MPGRIRWSASERAASKRLRPLLRDYTSLARRAHTLMEAAMQAVRDAAKRPSTLAVQVQARILTRISNDLRTIELAAVAGYSVQALSLLAGVYELANAVAFIGDDAQRASAWENHESPTDSYPPRRQRRDAVRATLLAFLDGPEAPSPARMKHLVDQQERLYTIACMAKHGNPKILRSQGVQVEGSTMHIYHGPYMSSASVKQSRLALFHAARLLIAASLVFARDRLSSEPTVARRFLRRSQPVMAQISRIMQRSLGHEIEAA